MNIDLQELTGYSLDIYILGLAAIVVILLIIVIINGIRMGRLKKRYRVFMSGQDAKSLEESLKEKMDLIDDLMKSDEENKKALRLIVNQLDRTYQKLGLVKYDAFNEMGGKLSFSLALLNKKNDGFIINAVHSREGCYTYIKEIINGNSIIMLADEEKEALEMAIKSIN